MKTFFNPLQSSLQNAVPGAPGMPGAPADPTAPASSAVPVTTPLPAPNLNPWQKPATIVPAGAAAAPASGPAPVAVAPVAPADPQAAFRQRILDMDLLKGTDYAQIGADLQEGKTDSLQTTLNTAIAAAVQQATVITNQLVDSRVEQAGTEATSAATLQVHRDMAFKELTTDLPFLAEPENAPIAQATLAAFMRQGQDVATAKQNALTYFTQLGDKMAQHYASSEAIIPDGAPALGAFHTAHINNNKPSPGDIGGAPDVDWKTLFNGPAAG